jgi:hypothetical protein
MLFNASSNQKWFGYNNLRIFAYAIGLPISLFGCSAVMLYLLKFLPENIPFKKYFTIIGLLFNYSAVFHFIWILWQKTPDLSMSFYLLSIALVSLIYIIAVFKFYKGYQILVKQLESHISKLFSFAYSINIKKQVKPKHQKEIGVKRIKVTREIHE